MAAQVCKPSYSAIRGRNSHVPLHLTTATIGSVFAMAIPRRSDTLFITRSPPTGQRRPSILPLSAPLTSASAIPEHPANPHPPQLTPGNRSIT